jgi:hypothetical protein
VAAMRDLVIRKPCTADWERMSRMGDKRYCDTCAKHVHDLSAMTRDEVTALLAEARADDRELCVRYLYDDHGNPVFRPERLLPRSGLLRAKRFVAMAALPLGLAACESRASRYPVYPQTPPPPITTTTPPTPVVDQPMVMGGIRPAEFPPPEQEQAECGPGECPLRQHP